MSNEQRRTVTVSVPTHAEDSSECHVEFCFDDGLVHVSSTCSPQAHSSVCIHAIQVSLFDKSVVTPANALAFLEVFDLLHQTPVGRLLNDLEVARTEYAESLELLQETEDAILRLLQLAGEESIPECVRLYRSPRLASHKFPATGLN